MGSPIQLDLSLTESIPANDARSVAKARDGERRYQRRNKHAFALIDAQLQAIEQIREANKKRNKGA